MSKRPQTKFFECITGKSTEASKKFLAESAHAQGYESDYFEEIIDGSFRFLRLVTRAI